jgi:hypothetical protein
MNLSNIRKFLLTLAASLGSVAASGIIQGTLATKLTLVISIIGVVASALVFFVPNTPAS